MLEMPHLDPTTPREHFQRLAVILRNESLRALHAGRTGQSYALMMRAAAVEHDAQAIGQGGIERCAA